MKFSIKAKFFVAGIAIVFALVGLYFGAFFGIRTLESTSEDLHSAVEKSVDIAKVKGSLSKVHEATALKLIGARSLAKVDLDYKKTLFFKWIASEQSLEPGKSKKMKAEWKEYLGHALTILNDFVVFDNTLDEFLSVTHEDVYREMVKLNQNQIISSVCAVDFCSNYSKIIDGKNESEKETMEKIKAALDTAAASEKSGNVEEALLAYKKVLQVIEDGKDVLLEKAEENEKSYMVFQNRMVAIFNNLNKNILKFETAKAEDLKLQKYAQIKKVKNVKLVLVLFLAGGAFVTLLALSLLTGKTVLPILQMKRKLEELSSSGGDLTMEIEVPSKDEIGDAVESLNYFIANLRLIVSDVKGSAFELDSISKAISSGTNDASVKTSESSGHVDKISSDLSDITSHLMSTFNEMKSTNDIVSEIAKKSEDSGEVLKNALEAMEDIESASMEIHAVTEVVNEIAFQTNLLSLNAAIEAARAGDSGKGFAVVADEVRALSQRSAEAASSIQSLIGATTSKIAVGVDLVQKSSDMSNKTFSEFRKIYEALHLLAEDLQRDTNGVGGVNSSLGAIRDVASSTAAFTEQMAATAQEMKGYVSKLRKVVDKFVV